jgi:hypothetical protein
MSGDVDGFALPDPCDPNCPEEFKRHAREILPRISAQPGASEPVGPLKPWYYMRLRI